MDVEYQTFVDISDARPAYIELDRGDPRSQALVVKRAIGTLSDEPPAPVVPTAPATQEARGASNQLPRPTPF